MLQVKTSSFFLFVSERLDIHGLNNYFFPQCIKQNIIFTVNMYVTKWNSESFAPIDASDLS